MVFICSLLFVRELSRAGPHLLHSIEIYECAHVVWKKAKLQVQKGLGGNLHAVGQLTSTVLRFARLVNFFQLLQGSESELATAIASQSGLDVNNSGVMSFNALSILAWILFALQLFTTWTSCKSRDVLQEVTWIGMPSYSQRESRRISAGRSNPPLFTCGVYLTIRCIPNVYVILHKCHQCFFLPRPSQRS